MWQMKRRQSEVGAGNYDTVYGFVLSSTVQQGPPGPGGPTDASMVRNDNTNQAGVLTDATNQQQANDIIRWCHSHIAKHYLE